MTDFINSFILVGALLLFVLSFVKICIMDVRFNVQKLASVLFILSSITFSAKILAPRVVNMLWLKIAILALIVGVLICIVGDRRRSFL